MSAFWKMLLMLYSIQILFAQNYNINKNYSVTSMIITIASCEGSVGIFNISQTFKPANHLLYSSYTKLHTFTIYSLYFYLDILLVHIVNFIIYFKDNTLNKVVRVLIWKF